MTFVYAIAALAIAASPNEWHTNVQAITPSGEITEGAWSGIDTQGNILLDQNGTQIIISPGDLSKLQWPTAMPLDPFAAYPVAVHLTDRSLLATKIISASSSKITIDAPHIGQIEIKLSSIAAIRFTENTNSQAGGLFQKSLANRPADEDIMLAVRGDRVTALRGVLESLDPKASSFRWRNRTVSINAKNTFAVVLASGVSRPTKAQALCYLYGGIIMGGRITGGNAQNLKLELATGQQVEIPVIKIFSYQFPK